MKITENLGEFQKFIDSDTKTGPDYFGRKGRDGQEEGEESSTIRANPSTAEKSVQEKQR